MGRPATDKKDRLVEAAMRRFHHDGVGATSLAAVANDAAVPLGNVYYYFRSKDALTENVIERWCAWVGESLGALDVLPGSRDRLRAFVVSADRRRQGYADLGCPLSALSNDLRNAPPTIAASSGRPLAMLRAWLTAQFVQITDVDVAGSHADFFLASLQGSFALAHINSDSLIVSRTVEHLLRWIDTVGPESA